MPKSVRSLAASAIVASLFFQLLSAPAAFAAAPDSSATITGLKGGTGYVEIALSNVPLGATNFKVLLSEDGITYAPGVALSPSDISSPLTLHGVENKSYFVKVQATNSSGDGPMSEALANPVVVGPKTTIKTSDGSSNAYLMGTYAEVGVRANGAFGTSIQPPAEFHGNTANCLGFRVDRNKDGWGNTIDDGDFFCPGTEYEGWLLKVGDTGADFHNNHTTTSVEGALSDISAADGLQSVKWTSNGLITGASANAADEGIKLRQVATVPDSSQVLHIDITLTNSSSATVNNIYYARSFDPDNESAPGIYGSTNTVLSRTNPAQVQSTWSNEALIVLASNDPSARAARRVSGLSGTSAKHIWDAPTSGSQDGWTSTTDPAFLDAGTGVAVKIESMAPGETRVFRISYILSDNEASLPTAPAIDSVTPGDGQLSLDLTGSGNEPTNYQYSLDGGLTFLNRSPASTLSPLVITGLTNGTSYQLKVRGVNSFGAGPVSNQFAASPLGAIGAPTIESTEGSTSSFKINFSQGSSGGNNLTNYEYSLSTNSGASFGTFTAVTPSSTASPITVAGLSPSTSYIVKIRAVSGADSGAESNAVSVSTARTPGAPSVSSVTAQNRTLSVNFSEGFSGGTPITTYEYSLDGGATWNSRSPESAASPLVISSLTNGTNYSVVLRAINELGSGDSSEPRSATPTGIPSAPLISGDATPASGAISVLITPGSDGGSTVTTYQYSTDRGATWQTRTDSGGTSANLSITHLSSDPSAPLTNGTEYQVQVRAVNLVGPSPASNDISLVPAVEPDAPSISSLTAGASSVTVEYYEVSNGGREITEVEYSIDAGVTWISAGSSSGTVLITGLNNGTAYPIQLRLVNAIGPSSASPTFTVTPSSTPDAPSVDAVIPSSEKLTVEFSPGANNGSAVTNYEYSLDGGSTWNLRSPAGVQSPLVITGLTNNSTYYFQMRAVNSNGPGTSTGTSIATMPRLIAEAPEITSIIAGNSSLTVNFTAGADHGIGLTNYEFSTDNGQNWLTRAPAETSSPVIISGLSNGTSYSVRLRAVNANGSGAQSAASGETPYAAPGKPTIISASNVSTGISVEFAPGSDNGRAITNYEYSSNGGSVWQPFSPSQTTTPGVITGLGTGTYFLKLRAVNLAGSGLSSDTLTVSVVDTFAPSLVSSSVPSNGLSISLIFNEAMSGSGFAPRFAVSVGGQAATISAVAVSGTGVTLTLTKPVPAGVAVSVQYVDLSGANDSTFVIQDIAGNDVEDFSASPINNSAITGAGISSATIQGEPIVGLFVTASAAITGNPAPTVTYVWQKATSQGGTFSDILGASASGYQVTEADLGSFIRVAVRASNSLAVDVATTSPTSAANSLLSGVSISGMALVGQSLVATASNLALASTVSYQWQRSSSLTGPFADIPSATGSSLSLPATFGGLYLRVQVFAQLNPISASATAQAIFIGFPPATGGSAGPGISYKGPAITAVFPRAVTSIKSEVIELAVTRPNEVQFLYLNGSRVTFTTTSTSLRIVLPRLSAAGDYDILMIGEFGSYTYANAFKVGLPDFAKRYFSLKSANLAAEIAEFAEEYSFLKRATCIGYVSPRGLTKVGRVGALREANSACQSLPRLDSKRALPYLLRTLTFDREQVMIVLRK